MVFELAENRAMSAKEPIVDGAIIRKRRKSLGLSLEELSEKTGISVTYLSRMETGARNISLQNLKTIAQAMGSSSASLLADPSEDVHATQPEQFPGVRFGGIVEAGAFRPDTGMNQDNTYRYIAMAPDPRYPVDSQFAFQVMGDSMERAGIIEGMYVLGIDLYAWERLHGEPGDGKLVIVARTRDHHPERELTVKRLRIFRDRIELHPESGNPAHQPFVSKLPLSEASMEWQIIAVILSASWLFT